MRIWCSPRTFANRRRPPGGGIARKLEDAAHPGRAGPRDRPLPSRDRSSGWCRRPPANRGRPVHPARGCACRAREPTAPPHRSPEGPRDVPRPQAPAHRLGRGVPREHHHRAVLAPARRTHARPANAPPRDGWHHPERPLVHAPGRGADHRDRCAHGHEGRLPDPRYALDSVVARAVRDLGRDLRRAPGAAPGAAPHTGEGRPPVGHVRPLALCGSRAPVGRLGPGGARHAPRRHGPDGAQALSHRSTRHTSVLPQPEEPAMPTRPRTLAALALLATLAHPLPAAAQGPPDFEALMAASRTALRALSGMDGVWRGKARILEMGGQWKEFTQTERVGPMLDSTVKVIEGRGYDAAGKTVFNAFAVLAWDAQRKALGLSSYTRGMSGDYAVTPTDSGFVWTIPAGPMNIRYTAMVRDGRWHEVGDRVIPGQDPVRFLEMDLRRVGSTSWPAAAPVTPR